MRRELASGYLGLLEGLSSDAQRVTDKMPANFLVLGLIHSIFPNSRIIYMRRNPVDTCHFGSAVRGIDRESGIGEPQDAGVHWFTVGILGVSNLARLSG
jgi:hypothetical protein